MPGGNPNWVKGVSGNPKGPRSKSYTLLRTGMEDLLHDADKWILKPLRQYQNALHEQLPSAPHSQCRLIELAALMRCCGLLALKAAAEQGFLYDGDEGADTIPALNKARDFFAQERRILCSLPLTSPAPPLKTLEAYAKELHSEVS